MIKNVKAQKAIAKHKRNTKTQKKYEDTIEERDNKKDALSVEEQAKVKTGEDDMCLGEGVYGEEVEGKEKDCKKDK